MKKKTKQTVISIFTIFIFLAALFSGTIMSQVEIPLYRVKEKQSSFEIREYPPLLVAEVEIQGERKAAISNGFKILAEYIFGNNQSAEKIAMTAPVIQESEKIAMTAPVLQSAENNQWKIRFVMPAKYTAQNLPRPLDPRVKVHEIPAKKFATIRFSGLSTQENIDKNLLLLKDFIKNRGISSDATPIYAFYNPPWTLPFLRRNEIWIEINYDNL